MSNVHISYSWKDFLFLFLCARVYGRKISNWLRVHITGTFALRKNNNTIRTCDMGEK